MDRPPSTIFDFRKVIKELLQAFSLKRLFLVYSLPLTIILCLLSGFDAFRQPDVFLLDRAFQ